MQTTLFALFDTPSEARAALQALRTSTIAEARWTARIRARGGARLLLRLVESDTRRGFESGALVGGLAGALVGLVVAVTTGGVLTTSMGFCALAGVTYGMLGSLLISLALPHRQIEAWQEGIARGQAAVVIEADDLIVRRRLERMLEPVAIELARPELG